MINWRLLAIGLVAFPAIEVVAQRLVPPPPGGDFCQSGEQCQVYRRVYFTAAGLGYVASERTLFRTTDRGTTWAPLIGPAAGRPGGIRELFLVNESTFFIYGNEFLRTTDYGGTFTSVSLEAPSLRTRNQTDSVREGFFFIDPQQGWAPGNGVVLATYDGGQTWKPFDLPLNVRQPRQLWMFGGGEGILLSARQVACTEDGGKTWAEIANSPDMDRIRCSVAGFCVGRRALDESTAYMSSDRGRTWRATETGITRDNDTIYDFQVISTTEAVIIGTHNDQGTSTRRGFAPDTPLPTPMPSRGLLLHWNGSNWQRKEYSEIGTLWTICYVTANEAWASADKNGILHSTDGAQTWTFVPDYYRQIAALTPSPVPFVVPTPPPTP